MTTESPSALTRYREIGMLCAVAWGTVNLDSLTTGQFQEIRRAVRLEMRHNGLALGNYGCDA